MRGAFRFVRYTLTCRHRNASAAAARLSTRPGSEIAPCCCDWPSAASLGARLGRPQQHGGTLGAIQSGGLWSVWRVGGAAGRWVGRWVVRAALPAEPSGGSKFGGGSVSRWVGGSVSRSESINRPVGTTSPTRHMCCAPMHACRGKKGPATPPLVGPWVRGWHSRWLSVGRWSSVVQCVGQSVSRWGQWAG